MASLRRFLFGAVGPVIPIGRYRKPWVAEQKLDLPGLGVWLVHRSYATEAEANEAVAALLPDAHPTLEHWRVRNRDATVPVQHNLFAA